MPRGRLRNLKTGCLGAIVLVPVAVFLLRSVAPYSAPDPRPATPLAGFSYSPKLAMWARHDPIAGLRTLLQQVQPDLVRLPVYWDSVAPAPDRLDFSETDRLLQVVAEYNAGRPDQKVRVVLVVGARNLGAPELYLPAWLDERPPLDLPASLRSPAYTGYLIDTLRRYASSPLLYGWQLENEPLDSTNPDLGNIAVPEQLITQEVDLAHRLDPVHPVVITTFNSATAALDRNADSFGGIVHLASPWKPAGHPRPALQLGDVLGLNAYVVTPNTPLARVSVDQRIAWKRDTLQYWAKQARSQRKQVWVTEMQAAPWQGIGGFTRRDLETSAQLYRDSGVSAVFLWGAEQWLDSPAWLNAARLAIATLDSPQSLVTQQRTPTSRRDTVPLQVGERGADVARRASLASRRSNL